MIPKYIERKINRHNELLEKVIDLEKEIDSWYAKKKDRLEAALDDDSNLRDEDFTEIRCGEEAMYISIENIKYNFNLLKGNCRRKKEM